MKFLTNKEMLFSFPEQQKICLRILFDDHSTLEKTTTVGCIYDLKDDIEFADFFDIFLEIICENVGEENTIIISLEPLLSKEDAKKQLDKLREIKN